MLDQNLKYMLVGISVDLRAYFNRFAESDYNPPSVYISPVGIQNWH